MDVPSESTGVITEKMNERKGRMENMIPFGENKRVLNLKSFARSDWI